MKKTKILNIILFEFSLIMLFGLLLSGQSCVSGKSHTLEPFEYPEDNQAIISFFEGEVYIFREEKWKSAEIGEHLEKNDIVRVVENSSCEIQFGNTAIILMEENTVIELQQVFHKDLNSNNRIKLILGTIACKVQGLMEKEQFVVRSEDVVCDVQGTAFLVRQKQSGVEIAVKNGAVGVSSDSGAFSDIQLQENQQILIVKRDSRPGPVRELFDYNKAVLYQLDYREFKQLKRTGSPLLVKVAIETRPNDAGIIINQLHKGEGKVAEIFNTGQKLDVRVAKNGYKERSFSIDVEEGNDMVYPVELEVEDVGEDSITEESEEISIEELKRNFENQVTTIKTLNENLEKEVSNINYAKSELEKKIEAIRKEKIKLESDIEILNNKIIMESDEKDTYYKEMTNLLERTNVLDNDKQFLREEISNINNDKSTLENELKTVTDKLQKTETEKQNIQVQLDQLREQLRKLLGGDN